MGNEYNQNDISAILNSDLENPSYSLYKKMGFPRFVKRALMHPYKH